MFTPKFRNLIVAAVLECVLFTTLLPVANGQKKTAPVEATPPPVNEEFKFGEVDLEVLEQSAVLDPQPNAFALPNGSIYVTTGLLSLMENESQLAAIIAHELTHVMRRHTYQHNRSNRKKFLTMNIMSAIGAYAPMGAVGAVITIVTTVAPFIMVATMYGYSRELEREADLKGIDMMISAEYAPEEMIQVMKLLDKDIEGENIRLFYNDHPSLDERIRYLSGYLGARAEKVTPQMALNRERAAYFRNMEPVMRHNLQLSI